MRADLIMEHRFLKIFEKLKHIFTVLNALSGLAIP